MRDYKDAVRHFSVESLSQQLLSTSLDQGLSAFIECCQRWSDSDRIALQWLGADGRARKGVSYALLEEESGRFANYLKSKNIGVGDVVAGLLPRIPELLVTALGTWRVGAIYQPLFTAFGPAAIETRVTGEGGSQAKLIVTDPANRPKLLDLPGCPPILVVGERAGEDPSFETTIASFSTQLAPVMLKGDDPFIVLFTSGTTGKPKGVRYPLKLLIPVGAYMLDGLDLRAGDNYWNVADPGWAYGMLYAVLGPLMLGRTTTMYEGPFTVESTVQIILERNITNLAAAPTAYRLMMAAGDEAVAPIAHKLRVASSAGEPLNPEVIRWAKRVLHCPINDHYGQTELAMLVNNHHGLRHPVKPGSAGLPMPGFDVAILDEELNRTSANTPGILAVNRVRSPLFTFSGYWKADTPSLVGDWYLTGDTMLQDEDGYFFFVGRRDDLITSAGYRIGPFDVESAIMEHPTVAEVAVVGKPDAERTEIVKAFIVLKPGRVGDDDLKMEIQQLVRTRLAAHAYPREIEFITSLPKTSSGKIQRFILRRNA